MGGLSAMSLKPSPFLWDVFMRWELHGHLGRGKSVAGGRSWLTSHQQVLVQMKKRSFCFWIWKGLLTYTVNVTLISKPSDWGPETPPVMGGFPSVKTVCVFFSGSDGHCSRVGYQGWMSWFCWKWKVSRFFKLKKQIVFPLFFGEDNSLIQFIHLSCIFNIYAYVYIYICSFYLCSLLKTWISFQTQALWRFPISARLLQL